MNREGKNANSDNDVDEAQDSSGGTRRVLLGTASPSSEPEVRSPAANTDAIATSTMKPVPMKPITPRKVAQGPAFGRRCGLSVIRRRRPLGGRSRWSLVARYKGLLNRSFCPPSLHSLGYILPQRRSPCNDTGSRDRFGRPGLPRSVAMGTRPRRPSPSVPILERGISRRATVDFFI